MKSNNRMVCSVVVEQLIEAEQTIACSISTVLPWAISVAMKKVGYLISKHFFLSYDTQKCKESISDVIGTTYEQISL